MKRKKQQIKGIPRTYQDPAVPLIALPAEFTSQRLYTQVTAQDKNPVEVENIKGPGCIRHIWFLQTEMDKEIILEITVDDAKKPQILAPLKSLFSVMQNRDPFFVDCCAYTVLPNLIAKEKDPSIPGIPGYNLFLPIPFSKSCRIRIQGPKGTFLGAMINWHKYQKETELTPYRLHAAHKRYKTTPAPGIIEMADVSGKGFFAGFQTGYIQKDHNDMVFHTGGITILLDGETEPNAIRGCNVEDDYGFAWGFNDFQSQWMGCPEHDNRGSDPANIYRRLV